MGDKPILFSAPMVRALLAGTKTQTRRLAKLRRGITLDEIGEWTAGPDGFRRAVFSRDQVAEPRIAVGDRLYVRETFSFREYGLSDRDFLPDGALRPWYWADGNVADGDCYPPSPSIHMPRWASRITLHVTDVRVERLQDISEDDARAEGIVCVGKYQTADSISSDPLVGYSDDEAWSHDPNDPVSVYQLPGSARGAYRRLWSQINGDGSWDANPWVAAYSFTVERANIDEASP